MRGWTDTSTEPLVCGMDWWCGTLVAADDGGPAILVFFQVSRVCFGSVVGPCTVRFVIDCDDLVVCVWPVILFDGKGYCVVEYGGGGSLELSIIGAWSNIMCLAGRDVLRSILICRLCIEEWSAWRGESREWSLLLGSRTDVGREGPPFNCLLPLLMVA